jgi:hypothetical protein
VLDLDEVKGVEEGEGVLYLGARAGSSVRAGDFLR